MKCSECDENIYWAKVEQRTDDRGSRARPTCSATCERKRKTRLQSERRLTRRSVANITLTRPQRTALDVLAGAWPGGLRRGKRNTAGATVNSLASQTLESLGLAHSFLRDFGAWWGDSPGRFETQYEITRAGLAYLDTQRACLEGRATTPKATKCEP